MHFFFLFLQSCLLLEAVFSLVCTLCEQRLGCHYIAFEGASLTVGVLFWLRESVGSSIMTEECEKLRAASTFV